MRRSLPILLLFACVSRVHAAERRAVKDMLRVQAAAPCLSHEALVAEAEGRLRDVAVPADLTVIVTGSPSDPRRLALQVKRGQLVISRRSFESMPHACKDQRAMVGLAIALALEAAQTLQSEAAAMLAPREHAWSMAATGLIALGLLAEPTPGVTLVLGRAFGPIFELRVSAMGLAAFNRELPQRSGYFHAIFAGLRADACARARLAKPLHARLCFGVFTAGMYASGVKAPDAMQSTASYVAVTNALELMLSVSDHWSWTLGAAPMLALHALRVGLADEHGAAVQGVVLNRLSLAVTLGPAYAF